MKKIQIFIATCLLIIFSSSMLAATPQNGPDNDKEGTRLNIWIPGFLLKAAAEIAEDFVEGEEKEAVDMLKNFGTMTICVREGDYYNEKSDKKMMRKMKRIEKRDYEELVSVISDGEKVNMSIKENHHGKIKRLVILVDDSEATYVFVKMHCKISADDISKLTQGLMDDDHHKGI
ncbi:MAG: DUF4252 domain-containing protein [Chitinophagales bacterium]